MLHFSKYRTIKTSALTARIANIAYWAFIVFGIFSMFFMLYAATEYGLPGLIRSLGIILPFGGALALISLLDDNAGVQ